MSTSIKITITNISMNRLTRQPKTNTEEHGKELRGTSDGLKLCSLKALAEVTRWRNDLLDQLDATIMIY